MYHLSLLILKSYEYDLLLLPSLICTASAFLMLVFQIGQPTYMFFHNVLKKIGKKNLSSVSWFGHFCHFFKVCPALFTSVVFQLCMSNELQSQCRPSVKSVTTIVPREELQTRCASHLLIQNPPQRHWCCFTPLYFPGCCSRTAMPL